VLNKELSKMREYPISINEEEIINNTKKYVLIPWTSQSVMKPEVIVDTEGSYLIDSKGKKILDFSSQLVYSILGHKHPKVVSSIKAQLNKAFDISPRFANDVRSELAKELAEITPGNLKKTLFTLGGAEANENALKIAKLFTGKNKLISRYRSYHGATYGAMSISGDNRRWPFEPLSMQGVVRVFDPYRYRCSFNKKPESCELECASHIEEIILNEGPDSFAAFFMEPIVGSSCCLVPVKRYMEEVRRICDKYKILIIADEIMTGFGRTGEWFASDHYEDLKPDILTFAKGVSAGYIPLGGCIVSEEIGEYFDNQILWCGLTLSGHPLSCIAALATIEVLKEEKLVERSKNLGEKLLVELEMMKNKHRCVGEVRGVGLFYALELVKDKETREYLVPWNAGDTGMTSSYIKDLLWSKGLSTFFRWNLLFIAPPLNISEGDLNRGISIIDETLEKIDDMIEKEKY